MRFRQRINVDFPHPEGPISAVAWFAATFRLMSYSAWLLPYQAFKFSTLIPTPMSLCRPESAVTHDVAHSCHCSHNQDNQHQGSGPRLAMPFIVWGNGIHENLQRQRGGRLIVTKAPELVAEGSEQQRRRLSGNARKGKHDSGNHARRCRSQRYRKCRAPAWNT